MKTYIATSLSNAEQARELSEALRIYGIETTYSWWTHGGVWTPQCPLCNDVAADRCTASDDGMHGLLPDDDSVEASQARCRNAAMCEADGVRDADFVIVILTDHPGPPCEASDGSGNDCGKPAVWIDRPYHCEECWTPRCAAHDRRASDARQAYCPAPRTQHGTHTELGMAIALNKPVLLFASSAARFETAETCAFYFAPTVKRFVLLGGDGVPSAFIHQMVMRAEAMMIELYAKQDRQEPLEPQAELGIDKPPARYSQNPDGKETIDRMFDECEKVYYESVGVHEKGQPFEPSDDDDGVRSALCAALCAAIALKYEDRAGKKGDPVGDAKKAKFFRQLQKRWEQNDPSLDPRVYRTKGD